MYTPEYLENIQNNIFEADHILSEALRSIEKSTEYIEPLHPFHAAAVNTYNRLTTIILTLAELEG
jgi:GTP1/Obg family GTP-binding protein